jgi:5,10-methylenetetrahydromethanopterin reductase
MALNGLRIGTQLTDPKPGPDPLAELSAQMQRAADEGFTSAWISHIFGLDAITALAVAGRGGPAIELGTAVVPTYPRHPTALAQQALTAQLALDGRFVLGIGLSHQIVIENMFGLSFDKPARHMREYLSVLLPLLRDGKVSFAGEVYKTELGLSGPFPDKQVPVLLAALAPQMLKLAGTVADGTILWMTGPATVRDHIAPRLTEAADAANRPAPRIVCTLPVCVTDDEGAARERANKVFAIYNQLPSYRAMLDKEGAAGPGDVAIVGDAASVREQIEGLGAAGVTDYVAAEFSKGEDAERTHALLVELLK